jgi:hypothetical protein
MKSYRADDYLIERENVQATVFEKPKRAAAIVMSLAVTPAQRPSTGSGWRLSMLSWATKHSPQVRSVRRSLRLSGRGR